MKAIPQIVVHGDADPTVSVAGSRTMVAEMKNLGRRGHLRRGAGRQPHDVVVPNLPKVFEFLAAQRRPRT